MMRRDTARKLVEAILPKRIFAAALDLRRRIYWSNAKRLRPLAARRTAQKLVASGGPIRLEIGSWSRPELPDWTSIDFSLGADIRHDLTKPLPFPDDSVEEIYSSHVLEHFTYPHPLLDVLHECHRVLKPGARFRAAVPNARLFLDAYAHPEKFEREKFCTEDVGLRYTSRIDVVNFIAYLGGEHKVMFDDENLPRVIEEAGFRDVRMREFDSSIDLERRRHESIYVEAVK
jgi:predicted SAM-dependent methyltransferase